MSTPTPQSNIEQYLSVIAGYDSEIPSEPSSRVEYFLNKIVENGGAGSGSEGTTNYNSLSNKPKINGKLLIGNLTAVDLGLVAVEAGKGLSANDYTDAEKDKLSGIPENATSNKGTVTSIRISGAGPIEVSDDTTITTSGERVISHADSGVTAGSKGDATNQTPGFGGTFKALSATVDAKGHITALGDHTVKVPSDPATSQADGLMSKNDKTKLDAIGVTASAPLEVTKTGETYNVTLKDSGVTAGSKGDATNQTPGFGGTFKALSATVDAKGRITNLVEHSVTIPNDTATANAAGLMSAEDKLKLDNAVTGVKGDKEASYRTGKVSLTPANIGAVATSAVGSANGVAELDANGIILSSQLPSYVDDVQEYAALADFPATGESGVIYIDTSTNLTYRWTGTRYTEISSSLALGETSSTAFRGDWGKTAYTHSQTTGNAHNMVKGDIGLGNVDNTSDLSKPVSMAQRAALDLKVDKSIGMAKGDILYFSDANTPVRLSIGANGQVLKVNSSGLPAWAPDANTTYAPATATPLMDATAAVGTSAKYAREDHVHPTDTSRASASDVTAQGDRITALEDENALLRELISRMEIYCIAYGNPATFEDGYAANVKALSVTITPTQSGSGDPSPTNVRPISGATSVSVTRTGENGANSQTVTVSLVDSNSNPFTVCSGTLNVTTGELTVTWGSVIISDASPVGLYTSGAGNRMFYLVLSNLDGYFKSRDTPLCDKLKPVPAFSSDAAGNANNLADMSVTLKILSGQIIFKRNASATVADMKAWLADNPVRVAYPLPSPVTYQLTPAQLATLSGYNSVSTDAAALSVTYRADPALTLGGGT